jgi:NAD(P)-dependent dehydrogenase (short-subunit alcohol dehydrogenase family)
VGGLLLLAGLSEASGAAAQRSGAGPSSGAESASTPAPWPNDLQVVLITGSTDGLGREVARRLAAAGSIVIIHGRNQERGRALVDEIERAGGSARFYAADFSSLQAVRDFAAQVQLDYDRLDVLVNNAGIWPGGTRRERSIDGYELTFEVNYLSGFLLTRLLLPMLVKSAPSRIINVASIAQTPIDFDDVMLEHRYTGQRAYGQSKLAQVMFTFDLAEELQGTGVIAEALHPGTLMNTGMVLSRGIQPRTTVEEGTEAVLHLIEAPDLESGQYFDGLKPARANDQAYSRSERAKLRRISAELTGVPVDPVDLRKR